MEKITIDEENKKRIQKYIKQEIGFYGYEQDIELLEKEGILTEELARKVFTKIMNNANRIRSILTPKKDDEFANEINEVFSKYDKIPKPEQLEKYGFYDGSYRNMELDEIYSNMQTAFELKELSNKYYECKDLRNIANTTIKSINGIDKYKIELQPEVKTELQEIQEQLKNLLAQKKTDVQAIQDRVDKYNSYAIDIWKDYLTDINNEKNSEYRWIVHNLTKGELQGDFRDKYMSTSIMTNNAMGLYSNANYGLIIKPKHIVSASYKDSYTLNDRENEDDLFNTIKPPLMLPQEIEEICIQQTIEANGEMLNYDKAHIYPELVIDDYEIEGIYYISNGEKELTRNYDRAKKMAEERGLPLKERDISKYREEHGLEPMTENTKKDFCKNILLRCCEGDKELKEAYYEHYYTFIDNHFQEFFEQFMQLKKQGEYSKEDILKVFSEITRNDIHFKKISQNVEEKKQLTPEREYAINNISDRENLQQRLEKIVSDGIFYGADIQNPDKAKKFEEIKKEIPQFEEFKEVYLQLRLAGKEDELYRGIDYKTVSYAELFERAKTIAKEQEELKKQSEIQQNENKQIEVVDADLETIVEEVTTPTKKSKEIEKAKEEKIRPMEEAIKDEVGDEFKKSQQEMEEINKNTVDLWMNRFGGWYGAIDRVTQNVKAKFVKMKSDIIKAIRDIIKERGNKQEINKNQDQNER